MTAFSPARRPLAPSILGMRVDATSYAEASTQVMAWAKARRPAYVCVANVHMVMESHDRPLLRDQINRANLVTPDGMPLVWMLRRLGNPAQQRVYGPTLMLEICAHAADSGVPVGFFGATPDTLERLCRRLTARFPALDVAYCEAPPFRPLSPSEDRAVIERIRSSGARILFVGLGCPKQEIWMAEHSPLLDLAMLGVGAAFDFHAGTLRQAPAWMQRAGLEWLFRLAVEPKRLWRRYARHNPRFVALALAQLWRQDPLKRQSALPPG